MGHKHITGKAVLITGAGGSIGAVLCAEVLALAPARLSMLSLTEGSLVGLMRTLLVPVGSTTVVTFLLGSVLDETLLARELRGVETVIHCAAHKHVALGELFPAQFVANNVGGTLAVCRHALRAGVTRCVVVSTDKAVQPSSVMGATKWLAERVVAAYGAGFLVVRFGNVLDSAGSVLPLWREQIARGGPVTVTDPAVTRYFMRIEDACHLILETLALDADHGTFVWELGPPQNLLQMAETLIAASGTSCPIVMTGLRAGEKLSETLTEGPRQPTSHPQVYQVEMAPALSAQHASLRALLTTAQEAEDHVVRQQLWSLVHAPTEAALTRLAPLPTEGVTFVCWKWHGTDPRRQFPAYAVNVLHAMLARHYHAPFRLICLTDDPSDLDAAIVALPLPETKADGLQAPRHGSNTKLFPACYRRLWLFSEEAWMLGGRICLLDIDLVILEDITGLLQRKTADFVGWATGEFGWSKIAGGFWLLTTGTHTDVWTDFDPATSPALAHAAGHKGSDQSWLSLKLYPPSQAFGQKDGIVKIGWLSKGGRPPPPGIKMVFTTGLKPPWNDVMQREHPWIKTHWHL